MVVEELERAGVVVVVAGSCWAVQWLNWILQQQGRGFWTAAKGCACSKGGRTVSFDALKGTRGGESETKEIGEKGIERDGGMVTRKEGIDPQHKDPSNPPFTK